jgi:hypothetical protein
MATDDNKQFAEDFKNYYMTKKAHFSSDGKCRHYLYRAWDGERPFVMFIGLNPSTADDKENDPTIESVIRIAKHNGYGGLYMMNCFPIISTDPDLLVLEKDYHSSEMRSVNIKYLREVAERCKDIVFAWGNFKVVSKYGMDVFLKEVFPNALCITKNKNGSPGHPLYKKGNSKLIKF